MSELFAKSGPGGQAAYEAVLAAVDAFGGVRVEEKKTSVHLMRKTAFAGVHPRRDAILLNIRLASPIESARVRNVEQVSANRYHNELLLTSEQDVDAEVAGWLRAAFDLSA